MTNDSFRQFVLGTIDKLDSVYDAADPDAVLETASQYATAAEQAGNLAAGLGHAELFRRSQAFGQYAEWPGVKAFFAECLASVPAPPPQTPIGETLGVDELAALLGVNVRTIYRRRNDGTLPPPIQVGRLVCWRRSDVDSFMQGN